MDEAAKGGFASLVPRDDKNPPLEDTTLATAAEEAEEAPDASKQDWAGNMRLLLICFLISGLYTICTYFFPILRNLPIFGTAAASMWLWTLNPSLAYVGQGIIMGTETTLHMTLGAVVGWGVLSPLAKYKGWAPGEVEDWEKGSKGWIVWVSLAIMLVDAVVSLAYVAFRPLIGGKVTSIWAAVLRHDVVKSVLRRHEYIPISQSFEPDDPSHDFEAVEHNNTDVDHDENADAPPEQRVSNKVVWIGLTLSILLCILTIHLVFGDLVPLYATVIAVLMALILSIMGVRALGETDLNPVSGISKLAQLFFALIIPQSNSSSVLINLVAGAVVSKPLIVGYPHKQCN